MKRRQFLTMAGTAAAATAAVAVTPSIAEASPMDQVRDRMYESGEGPACKTCLNWSMNAMGERGFGKCHYQAATQLGCGRDILSEWAPTMENDFCAQYIWRKNQPVRIAF